MTATSIQWCDHSINPIRARHKKTGAVGHYCEKIAQGCTSCYSSAFQKRFGLPPFGAGQHRDEVEIFLDESKLDEVRRRKKPTKYFWCDMTDIFGDWMQPEWLQACFSTMDATPQHTHLLLTKRPENIRRMWVPPSVAGRGNAMNHPATAAALLAKSPELAGEWLHRKNVWIGCSVSTQADADRNIPELLKCRDLSDVLFVSAEPLVEAVHLGLCRAIDAVDTIEEDPCYGVYPDGSTNHTPVGCMICPTKRHWRELCDFRMCGCGIDWVIAGGESGPHARPCRPEWIRSLVAECRAASVPCFVKQMGANIITRNDQIEDVFNDGESGWPDPEIEHDINGFRENYQGADCRIKLRDPKGGDLSEWPEDLRVRQFPTVAQAAR